MVFVASMTSAALWARTSGRVSGYNLACNAAISCSILVLTFWISVLEVFRAATSPSILAWGVAKARMSSVTSTHSFFIRRSNSVSFIVARMHAACDWDASVVFSTIVCSVLLRSCYNLQYLCWIPSKRDVWRTCSGLCRSRARSRCTSAQAWTCVHKVGRVRVSVALSRG